MKQTLRVAGLAIALVARAVAADAGPILITLDTSPLSGTQTAVFGLTNSDSSSNNVTLSSFAFGGGSVVSGSADCTLGGTFSGLGCSGDLASSVTLDDADDAAFFSQQFEPGSTFSFILNATNNFTGPTPDQFAMFLCDGALNTCYSDDASGALLLLDFAGGNLMPSSFVRFGASAQELAAPTVAVAAVPEPGTLTLLGAGAALAAARWRRRKLTNWSRTQK